MTALADLRILIAEESDATRVFLADNLTADGAAVDAVESGRGAIVALRTNQFDVVIADVNGDTLELIGRVHGTTPIIVLGGRDELDVVRKLDHGADDVLAKPFSYPELCARVRAVIRRQDIRRPRVQHVGDLHIDRTGRMVYVHGNRVELTRREFTLLCALAEEPTRVWTKEELSLSIWGANVGSSRTLDAHAARLRHGLQRAGVKAVVNVWGVGYRLCDAPAQLEVAA